MCNCIRETFKEVPREEEKIRQSCSQTMQQNICNAAVACAISTAGSLVAGFYPTVVGVAIGSNISGFANGLGVYLPWRREDIDVREIKQILRRQDEEIAVLKAEIVACKFLLQEKLAITKQPGFPLEISK